MLPKIEGSPYQADCEWIRVDNIRGRQVTTRTMAGILARDSSGRRLEEHSPSTDTGEQVLRIAIIYDPSGSLIHILDRKSKTLISFPIAAGESGLGGFGLPNIDVAGAAVALSPGPVSGSSDRILGEQVVDGMTCKGYSRSVGNTKTEYWVSEDLQDTILMRVIADDFELTFRAYNIRRNEPDSELFSIPSDYQAPGTSDCYFRAWPQ